MQEKDGATVSANLLTGLRIDEVFQRTQGAVTSDVLPDALGSSLALADSTKAVTTQYTYAPYGATTQTGPANNNAQKFTGREDDGVTGLYYYRARYYSPKYSRFVAGDPIGFAGGPNIYAYVRGNPLGLVDPLRLKSRVCCRRIPGIGGLGFRHCYVESNSGGDTTSYGLIGGTFSGEPAGTGNVYVNNLFDTGGDCGEWVDNCNVDQCVKDQVDFYPNPSSYTYAGPNSNTFAGTIARACKIPKPPLKPSESTPGWGSAPAPQKPDQPYKPPTNLAP